VYPVEARVAEARGHITMALTIDAVGNVTGSHVRGINIRTSKNVDTNTLRDVTDAVIRAAMDAVQQFRYEAPGRTTVANAVIEIRPPGEASRTVMTFTQKIANAAHTYPPNALRVDGVVKAPRKTYHVNPVYPAPAQEAGVEGIVVLETLIDEAGAVAQARVLRGVPLLDQAALDAVKEWKFQPTLMNGVPVPVIMTLTVSFVLENGAPSPLPPPPPPPPGMEGQPISMVLSDADVRELLQFFAARTGQKIDVDPTVKGTVSVSFSNASWREALEAIARAGNLSYTIENKVIRIARGDGRR
jgi:TonB family protein